MVVGDFLSLWMTVIKAVNEAVLVDVSRAEGFEANQADPVLNCCVTFNALAVVVKSCWGI